MRRAIQQGSSQAHNSTSPQESDILVNIAPVYRINYGTIPHETVPETASSSCYASVQYTWLASLLRRLARATIMAVSFLLGAGNLATVRREILNSLIISVCYLFTFFVLNYILFIVYITMRWNEPYLPMSQDSSAIFTCDDIQDVVSHGISYDRYMGALLSSDNIHIWMSWFISYLANMVLTAVTIATGTLAMCLPTQNNLMLQCLVGVPTGIARVALLIFSFVISAIISGDIADSFLLGFNSCDLSWQGHVIYLFPWLIGMSIFLICILPCMAYSCCYLTPTFKYIMPDPEGDKLGLPQSPTDEEGLETYAHRNTLYALILVAAYGGKKSSLYNIPPELLQIIATDLYPTCGTIRLPRSTLNITHRLLNMLAEPEKRLTETRDNGYISDDSEVGSGDIDASGLSLEVGVFSTRSSDTSGTGSDSRKNSAESGGSSSIYLPDYSM